MSDYNQLRSSLIKRLEKAEPEILIRLKEIEGMHIHKRPSIDEVFWEIPPKVFSDFMSEMHSFWKSNEDNYRKILADLIVNNKDFIEIFVSESISVSMACDNALEEVLGREAYDWFCALAYNFKQTRHNKTGSAA